MLTMMLNWAGRALCELGLHWMGDVETVPWVRGQNALVVDCTRPGCSKRQFIGLIPYPELRRSIPSMPARPTNPGPKAA